MSTYEELSLIVSTALLIVAILNTGEIGIFMVNNECYIKEVGEDGLLSHNPKYKTIPGAEDIHCIGKVLGKVDMNA